MKPITLYRWTFKPEPETENVEQLGKAININPVLAKILVQRQIADYDTAKSYFRPSLTELHDPFLMKNMEIAVLRLQKAIRSKEKVVIYGDYDVDGTTSVALVFGFLKKIYPHVDWTFYIPNRYKEGYGISFQGIDWASENGFSLIISLDCGIKAFETISYAKQKNIDFIICDHHLPDPQLPPAVAILDAKQPDCTYPYKHLSGCGVGFKFLQALSIAENLPFDELFRHLDLLALSIAADIVPITGENRILTYHGLLQLNDNHRFGTEALAELAGLRKPIDISSIVFGLAPRINVFGRLNHAKTAVELLLSEDMETARQFSRLANQYNEERQGYDSLTTEEAIDMIEKNGWQKNYSTVLFKAGWNKGIVGIVASRCIEHYYRPTIILTQADDKIVGSARSVSNFDMYEALTQCRDLLDQYGGHHHAAGLAMKPEKLPEFREKFEKIAASNLRPEDLIPEIEIDAEVPQLSMLTFQFLKILHQMSPFGPNNMSPVFVSRNVTAANIKTLKEKHLRFYVKQGNTTLEAIAFQMAAYFNIISYGKPFDVCYTVAESNFLGVKSIQLTIKDIKPSNR